jgi:hypothetical protein
MACLPHTKQILLVIVLSSRVRPCKRRLLPDVENPGVAGHVSCGLGMLAATFHHGMAKLACKDFPLKQVAAPSLWDSMPYQSSSRLEVGA